MNGFTNIAAPLSRLLLAGFWLHSGYAKTDNIAGLQGYMAKFSIPDILAWPVVALEIAAGIMILTGFFSRYASLALAVFCITAAVIFHSELGDRIQFILFAKNFAIAGGLLMIVAHGPGPMALNQR